MSVDCCYKNLCFVLLQCCSDAGCTFTFSVRMDYFGLGFAVGSPVEFILIVIKYFI